MHELTHLNRLNIIADFLVELHTYFGEHNRSDTDTVTIDTNLRLMAMDSINTIRDSFSGQVADNFSTIYDKLFRRGASIKVQLTMTDLKSLAYLLRNTLSLIENA